MPVHQRIVYGSQAYGSSEIWEDSSAGNILADVRMSGVLGAVNQINFMSSYCFEMFDSLATLSDGIHERVDAATKRTESLVRKIEDLEQRRVHRGDSAVAVSGSQSRLRFLSKRDAYIPDVLAKATNSNHMKSAYNVCSAPPRLWKMDGVVNDDCAIYYSNPGFFFDEWLRVEQERQFMRKEEQKKEKSARNQLKMERKKLRKARNKSIIMESLPEEEDGEDKLKGKTESDTGSDKSGSDGGGSDDDSESKGDASKSGESGSESQSDADRTEDDDTSINRDDKKKNKEKKSKKDMKEDDKKKKKKKGAGRKDSVRSSGSSERSSSSSKSSASSKNDQSVVDESGDEEEKITPAQKKGLFGLFGSPGSTSPHRHTELGLITEEKKSKRKLGIFGMRGSGDDKGDKVSDRKSKALKDDDDEPVLSARERAIKARARAATKIKKPQQKSNLLSEAKLMRDANADEEKRFTASKMDSLHAVPEEDDEDSDKDEVEDVDELKVGNKKTEKTLRPNSPTKEGDDAASVSSNESEPSSASSSPSSASSSSTVSSSSSSSVSSSSASMVSSSSASSSASSRESSVSEPKRSSSDTGRKKTNIFKRPSPPRRDRKSEDPTRPSTRGKGPAPPPPPPPPKRERKSKAPPPPPPPPVPARPRLGSALRADIGKAGIGMLKKTEGPKQRASVSNRNVLLAGIRKGDVQLNKVKRPSESRPSETPQKEQHAAISAILANRAKIAGSDSDDSESDESEISF